MSIDNELDVPLIFASRTRELGGDSRALRRDADAGRLHRITRGVFLAAAAWSELTAAQRHRLQVIAIAAELDCSETISHRSAAALWGIPILGVFPSGLEVTTERRRGGRSEGRIRRRCLGLDGVATTSYLGLTVTTPAQTAVDLARGPSFAASVVSLDAVLNRRGGGPLATAEELGAALLATGERRGGRRAQYAVSFATDLSESVGESRSRVAIHQAGFPRPELQVEFRDAVGSVGRVDFWWPEFNLVGEFDGLVKYRDERLRNGRSAEQVVIDEKLREDRLRRLGPRVVRWVNGDVDDPRRLYRILIEAGLPLLTHARGRRSRAGGAA
jgi:hypothetical protein